MTRGKGETVTGSANVEGAENVRNAAGSVVGTSSGMNRHNDSDGGSDWGGVDLGSSCSDVELSSGEDSPEADVGAGGRKKKQSEPVFKNEKVAIDKATIIMLCIKLVKPI